MLLIVLNIERSIEFALLTPAIVKFMFTILMKECGKIKKFIMNYSKPQIFLIFER